MRRPAAKLKPRIAQTTRFAAPIAGLEGEREPLRTRLLAPQGAIGWKTSFRPLLARKSAAAPTYTPRLAGEICQPRRYSPTISGTTRSSSIDGNVHLMTSPRFLADQLSIRRMRQGDNLITDLGDFIGQLSTGGLEVITGLTGGDWIDEQFATTGGNFLVIVNGRISPRL
ncbi:hypothetical protein [Sinorhizobium psoraleae]|uniref:Uncharacterized protein n=1 Tax=Sinorhizobium psoraleae TaxID=520838 RepID=A0ABT4KM58_9HYPH|nr:hypothetical protein [Sinorhizobium psoraleae]MCZ4093053.1 hypothetical protein [Sinorhizobium psoraleae]